MLNFFKKNRPGHIIAQEIEDQDEPWLTKDNFNDGQLLIDAYQKGEKIIIRSTIAGAKPQDINISLHNDLLTIKGRREFKEKIKEEDYLYKECHWGSFSRSLILPSEVDPKNIEAILENGVLTVILNKKKKPNPIKVKRK
ncbi:MAG: Hsp20/alpha crystallin family protein [Planctomycetes bacterium]|jgi:HSP20 family protein|nr:Hsp20/alpha crystallin family protein [Planctomycetota bacterium]